MNPSYQAEHMGIGPNNISGPSSDPVLVPQTAILRPWVNVPGTGNAILGSFSGSVQPQQIGGCAQQYYNTNCFPNTEFGATDIGINSQTFSTNPAQNIREENTVPITEFASLDNSLQAPGTSIPGCHAAGGLPPSELLMGSDQSLPRNVGQENLGVHEVASSSMPTGDDMDKFLEEFLEGI
ncbi:putative two-component response regulator ORR22-like [Cocos nucifera]|uniref:Putative two-component response regulator ORR22-like n=1 Tax=Cocos nucifera TaxID=13894 RepID=A0A8K0I2X4_COCNU|nr:putative two-component response regulator ORR22-like [Cocos nucifera]